MTLYDDTFFHGHRDGMIASATVVVPSLVRIFEPMTVVDVGCGIGAWAGAFHNAGCDVLALDGDYVERASLLLPAERFEVRDLNQPLSLTKSVDLVVCLEVAEHLSPTNAKRFVRDLTKLAPVVVFSAAIPGQGGAGHINEQWPQYWADLFEECDHLPIDNLRPFFWSNKQVSWWYAQNMISYVHRDAIPRFPSLPLPAEPCQLARVHPELWTKRLSQSPSVRSSLSHLRHALWNSIRRSAPRGGNRAV